MEIVEGLFRQHRQYEKMDSLDVYHTLELPEAMGRLCLYNVPGGQVCFTWTRPTNGYSIEKLMAGRTDEQLWRDHSPDGDKYTPWIVDVAASPGVSGLEIGKFLRWACIDERIARDGQTVLFHRNGGIRPGRIGFFKARA